MHADGWSYGHHVKTTAPFSLSADRFKAFADAVVAIAMTLLILPLMEAVSEGANQQSEDPSFGTAEFLSEHAGQLISLVLSFVMIAMFWLDHHRVFDRVERATSALLSIMIVWLFCIVLLPVTTAMIGAMVTDPLQAGLYIGNLALTQATMVTIRVYLLRHPELHDIVDVRLRRGVVVGSVGTGLLLVALTIAACFPAVGYYALLILMLTGPVAAPISRRVVRTS